APMGEARVALVTGGAKGIGRAVSEKLAASGWNLWLCGRDAVALDLAAAELCDRHRVEVRTMALDLADAGAVETLFELFPTPDALPLAMICGAADYGVLGPLAGVDFGAWKRSFDLNFFSVAE